VRYARRACASGPRESSASIGRSGRPDGHTYASLCVAAGIPPLQLSRFMGHAKVTTTLAIYTHLFDDDHAETIAALEAMSRPVDAERRTDAPTELGRRSVVFNEIAFFADEIVRLAWRVGCRRICRR
jgi:hypothetical protein